MKYMTGVGFGPLACAANMMSAFGRDVEDQALARGMELPFLFASTPDGYQAGVRLCTTARMNQYLTSLGLTLLEQEVAREQLPGLLASVRTASVALSTKTGRHSAVYMGMSGNRLRFVVAKTADSDVPDELLLTKAMLLRRVDERVRVCFMEECAPVAFDPKPLLLESLRVQTEYHNALVQLWTRQIQHDEIKPVFRRYLRALIVDAPSTVQLAKDDDLAKRLHRLARCYHTVHYSRLLHFSLVSHVPWDMMHRILMSLREITFDRLSELGVSDAEIDRLMVKIRRQLLPAPTMDALPYHLL